MTRFLILAAKTNKVIYSIAAISVIISLTAKADLDDNLPSSSKAPEPAPAVAPTAIAPKVSTPSAQPPSPAPTPKPKPEPTSSTKPAGTAGGDFLSGNVFADIKHNTNAPIVIPSPADKFTASRNEGTAVLEGHVVVEQDNLRITCDRMEMFLNKATNKAERALAKGNVYLRKKASEQPGDFLEAWGAELEYNLTIGKMILQNNAQIARGKDCKIYGDILEYELASGFVTGKQMRGSCLPVTNAAPGAGAGGNPKPKSHSRSK